MGVAAMTDIIWTGSVTLFALVFVAACLSGLI
jgi:hypothetical protein